MTSGEGPEKKCAAPETEKDAPKRRVPRVLLIGMGAESDLLALYPGHFVQKKLEKDQDLAALILGRPIDLCVLDFREEIPAPRTYECLRDERIVQFLAVGIPGDRKGVPQWLRPHWCPWPVDRRAFYRLITALSSLGKARRQIHQARAEKKALAREADLGRRVAEVLHDLGNPLDATARFLRLAKDETDPAKLQALLADAEIGVERMKAVVSALNREARRIAVETNTRDIRDVIRESALIAGVVAEDIRFEVHLHAVRRIPQAIAHVVTHLLDNARKAIQKDGRIDVRVEIRDRSFVIVVGDDGEGFADLFKDEIFKPYMSARPGGTGLGLSHSRYIVERFGGTIEGESLGLERGAAFTVTLPLESTEPPADARNAGTDEDESR